MARRTEQHSGPAILIAREDEGEVRCRGKWLFSTLRIRHGAATRFPESTEVLAGDIRGSNSAGLRNPADRLSRVCHRLLMVRIALRLWQVERQDQVRQIQRRSNASGNVRGLGLGSRSRHE